MPESTAVTSVRDGSVATLTLSRPADGNTLSEPVLDALLSCITSVQSDPSVRAIVITGAGQNFSLGGDLGEFSEALSGDLDYARTYATLRTRQLADVVAALYGLPVPVIAAVNGQAAGAGLSLALACDIRIAHRRTRMNFAYGALGLSTDGGMSWLLPRVVGPAQALALLLEQPILRAARAHELHMVTEVVPEDQLQQRAHALARTLADLAPHTVRSAKRLSRASALRPLSDHVVDEHQDFVDGFIDSDMRVTTVERDAVLEGRAG